MDSDEQASHRGRGPDADRRLLEAMKVARAQGADDFDMILALYGRHRADNEDPVLTFGLVEATLAADGFDHRRALRALAAAADRLHSAEGPAGTADPDNVSGAVGDDDPGA